ncbi:hypothetical protein [Escherichia coli]|uniref:hypothetical protein n=1 Tax=Escherichia coli TaxID=562 RepID=UPI000E1D2829|nr:hypothetical protein [Escherichia coli]RDP00320.1 hypothetical protein C4A62_01899 [Escherichia coli]RDP26637.1 hypothetical protein C4A57_02101 [Escherichia coli]HBP3595461.1 hypothetical protein [Escherichia coli]
MTQENKLNEESHRAELRKINVSMLLRSDRMKGLINVYEVILWFMILYYLFKTRVFNDFIEMLGPTISYSLIDINPGIKSFIVGLVPMAFTLVYRVSPIQLIIRRLSNSESSAADGIGELKAEIEAAAQKEKTKEEVAEAFLQSLVYSSSALARDIFSRGSLYLFFGVIFSICGLGFFYTQVQVVSPTSDFKVILLTMAPKFGILFFIELISFFFLKQYRVTMDEFRYYEAIKRSREETLAIVKIISINNSEIDYMALLDKLKFSSNVGKLDSGQTTELLEARKFDKDELDFLAKIVEAVAKKGS